MKRIIFSLAAVAAFSISASAQILDTASTSLSASITAGAVTVAVSTNSIDFGAQAITTDAGKAYVAQDGTETYTITITDLRGASEDLTLKATISPLKLGATTHVRPTRVVSKTPTGSGATGFNASYSADVSAVTTGAVLGASTTNMFNRHVGFTVEVTPLELRDEDVRAGAYTGSIAITVE